MSKYLEVSTWTEAELSDIPLKETDEYEYKASQNYKPDDLKIKIQKAASAFWNSGGGYFVVGYDEDIQQIDGGILPKIGQKDLSDWIDTALNEVTPVGQYQIRLIEPISDTSRINSGNVVLVIGFAESFNLPHMATDNKYYIRAGAHTVPAKHFIVEALRANRNVIRPMLYAHIRPNPTRAELFDFAIIAANNAPALNVGITMAGLPEQLEGALRKFLPLRIAIIDINNPFRMEFASYIFFSNWFPEWNEEDIQVEIQYQDLAGRHYSDTQLISPIKSVGPLTFGQTIEGILKDIHTEIEMIRKSLQDNKPS